MNASFESPVSTAALATLKRRVAGWSIVATVIVTTLKLTAGLVAGSLALLADGAHGLLDIGATTLTFFAVRQADRPADEDHHYGHGKIEAVAALCESTLLALLAFAAFTEAGRRLVFEPHTMISASPFAFAAVALSICVDATRWRALHVVARSTGSEALAADALHFSSDLASSLAILVGLAAAKAGYVNADAKATLIVAVLIGLAAVRLARRVLGVLLDTAPEGVAERVRQIAWRMPGVLGIDSVRVRPAGGVLMGDVSVTVARSLPLDRVSELKLSLARAVAAELKRADFRVSTRPVAPDDESVLERVMLIAAREHVLVHHVTVQWLDDRLSIGFDIELDGRLTLKEAHGRASRLEAAVHAEFGPATEVESHIEPLETRELSGMPADASVSARIAETLSRAAAPSGEIGSIHNVRVRQTPAGLVVHFHCLGPPDTDVATIHAAVDEIEQKVKHEIADIVRLVGHAEPAGAGHSRTSLVRRPDDDEASRAPPRPDIE
ncbi:MAG: cation diffusion facilitator family transporter [Hyphomicrobiales bacterium]|nr:cation diffusion facilitator family transporter [Hyphomicrobiales bacterium]